MAVAALARCGVVVEGQGRLCAECWRSLTFLGPPQCRLCGYPLPHALPAAPLCGECAREEPAYDRARSALRYDDGARRLRLLKRGYNQSAILARALARETGLRLIPDLLQRQRATPSQQGLSGQARLENVTAGAFRVHPWHRQCVAGRRVVLIDDVLTTGATAGACARVLGRAGASQVDVLTLARVVRDAATPI